MTRQPDRRTVLTGLGAVAAALGGNCRRATSGSWPQMVSSSISGSLVAFC